MSSNPKWETPLTMTVKEYFSTPWLVPHEGFVRLVRELEKEIGKEKTHKIVSKVRGDCAKDFAARTGGGKRLDSFDEFLKKYIPALHTHKGIAHMADGYTEESQDCALKSIYTSCIFSEIYKEWNATDIGYLWNCMADHAMINAFCEQAGFERPKCLMQGDENCTFCWNWEEN